MRRTASAYLICNGTRTSIVLGFVLCILSGSLLVTEDVSAFTLPPHKYPRTAAFFLKTSPLTDEEMRSLVQFDLIILNMETQRSNPPLFKKLRDQNPNVVLLAYVSPIDTPFDNLDVIEERDGMWHRFAQGLAPEWFLKTYDGRQVGFWPGNRSLNLSATSPTRGTHAGYVADFIAKEILATTLWDGVFFETVWDGIWWLNHDIDIDNDGVRDEKEKIDQTWRDGHNLLFKTLRDRFGDQYLFLSNGVLESYAQYLNGRMFEGFPDPSEGGWVGSVKRYRSVASIGVQPHVTIVNSDTKNTGNWKDWQRMRYGLATTLLFDGYYNFDFGTQERDRLWRYDEYDVSLGKPSSFPAKNLLNSAVESIVKGLWRRDFQNGIILVNSTSEEQSLRLDEEFERLHGKQDPETNDGLITSRVTLPPESGILLMRPIEAIVGSPFTNGAFTRIFNKYGDVTRTGFFAYEAGSRGGTMVAKRDLDRDGNPELIVADANRISIQKADGTILKQFFPYGENASYGIRLALGDIDGDGKDEIITTPSNGGSAYVKIFRNNGAFVRGWLAYGPSFKGGASVALGDLDGDGVLEIITGAGAGREPEIRLFRANGESWGKGWLAYAKGFRGGVQVAVGDLDGDRRAEIITGAGRGGGPQVRIFNGTGRIVHPGFFAFTSTKREGVDVLAHDFDGDGKAEIVAMSTNVFTTAGLFRR